MKKYTNRIEFSDELKRIDKKIDKITKIMQKREETKQRENRFKKFVRKLFKLEY